MALAGLYSTSRRRRRLATAGSLGTVAAVVVAGALIYPGFTTADVELNDGSVWVTNKNANMVGHLNAQSKVLDGGFAATTTGFDVLQHSGTVFMDNDSGTLLNQISVPDMSLGDDSALQGSKTFSLGSTLMVLADKAKGSVWALPSAEVPSFNDQTTKPILESLGNANAVVALEVDAGVSTVVALDARKGELTTAEVAGDGSLIKSSTSTVEGLPDKADLQLTVVGDKPVILDAAGGTVYLPGNKRVQLGDGDGAKLQQRSTASDFVAIETRKGLVNQPLDGSAAAVAELGAQGTPVAPVQQDGCIHAAWGGVNQYLRYCVGGENTPVKVPQSSGQSQFVFRQNRDVVVLNDVNGGNVWLVNQNLFLVNNWDDIKTDTTKADESKEESADPNVVNTLPDRTQPNRAPTAEADEFGVRPGKTTILPVLYNDSDPDGDVLAVRPVDTQPAAGAVASIYGGTGLQITVPANAAVGDDSFTYTADDGRGGTAAGRVALHIVPPSTNRPPLSRRESTLIVAQGQSVSQNVLADMIDPDGDDVFLTGAVSDDGSADLKFTPDGNLTYADNGQSNGPKTATISVSDAVNTMQKKIAVNVRAAGGVPPVANADFVRVTAGQPTVIAPLKNDQDPSGGQLRLASVEQSASGTVSEISDNGTVTYTSSTLGTVYLQYQVTNGPLSSTGLIRVEVVAAGSQEPPTAVKDTALLPAGGSVLVDVLGNDTDPGGGVLVVKSVEVPADAPISATLLDHNVLKLTDTRGLQSNVTVKYTISNGHGTAVGDVEVIHIPAASTLLPPVARPDTAKVRAGDVVTIPVLANDIDPNGSQLTSPEVIQAPDAAAGKIWVHQDSLRFLAGPTAGTVDAIYKVTNQSNQSDSATVRITVIAPDPEHNLPPAPKDLTGRVVAGSKTRIQVPLDEIDPDGDSVELVGLDKAPQLGTAVPGNGFIEYTAAGNAAGTDSFTYRVRDRFGASATATVRVGVAPVETLNHPPVANDDFITIRPGRNVALDVALNDSDPDGDTLAVAPDGFNGPGSMNPHLSPVGRVIVTSPQEAGLFTMGYTVKDRVGAPATANIRMTVTPEAPLRAPIARDDTVTAQDALGKNTVSVPVLKNDEDPDGVTDDLKLSLDGAPATARIGEGGTVLVDLLESAQMLTYTITDVDGLASTAIIRVPGQGEQYPVLAKNDVIKVQAGQSATLDLKSYVKVRDGRTPRVTQVDKISLIGAGSENLLNSSADVVTYAAREDFYGPGSITFEVTDGTGPDDPEGLKSTLTVMTEVAPAPAKNLPPLFQGSSLDVPQGDDASVDLGPLATDPEGDKLTFSFDGDKPAGFSISLDGTVLKVRGGSEQAAGTTSTIGLKVNDGHNPDAKAGIQLRLTSSTRPLAVANDDTIADAHAGREENVAVTANDVNPFPETPLKVVDAVLETGAPGTIVVIAGDRVNVTAPESFTGNVVVRYAVEDQTGDKARQVNGRIRLNVKGKPAVPTAPRIVEAKDKSVMLQWATPADNGSPLTGYTVLTSAGVEQACPGNTCLVAGLKNDTPYTFTVKANNDVGSSAYSPASASATPDKSPDAPAAPTIVRGDTELDVSWVAPVGEFSAVKSYNLEISPAPAGQNGQKTGLTGTKYTWTGLKNGTAYTFRVQAVNNAPNPSAWSSYAPVPVKPVGKPATPAAPTVAKVGTTGDQNQVRVDWAQPSLNGGTLKSYTLTTYLNGTVSGAPQTLTGTSTNVALDNASGAYTFTVAVANEVTTSDTSAHSAPMRSVSKPGRVASATIAGATSGAGGTVTVSFQPLSEYERHGSAAGEISYYANLSTGATGVRVQPGGTAINSPNGTAVSVAVYAQSSAFAGAGDAVAASPASVTPYGSPGSASVTAKSSGQGDKTAYYSWSAPGGATDSAYVEINEGGGWVRSNANSGQGSIATGGYSTTRTVQIRSINSVGTAGPVDSANITSGSAPPPPADTVRVKAGDWHSCTTNGSDGNFSSNPATCDGVVSPGGNVNLGGHWLDYADGWVEINSCGNPYGGGSRNWYHMTTGPQAGRWVRADTVDKNGGQVGC
ncbi:Ig-like domain-containing protein [Arthrobacter sp. 35W]|uniref:Ig-like domain-containing protein n=1 Tax=Arthrobacter sp. 35W TaxID=1132441 RepID=UPI0003F70F73|nr:Ig-like domain-containing protein [Arthrobacter sp. 35W]